MSTKRIKKKQRLRQVADGFRMIASAGGNRLGSHRARRMAQGKLKAELMEMLDMIKLVTAGMSDLTFVGKVDVPTGYASSILAYPGAFKVQP